MFKKTKLFDGIEEYNTIASKYGHNIANISAYYSKYYESLANKYAKEKNLRDSNGKKHISYDNEADAYRHSMWNVALTKNIGINEAKFIADNHEIKALKDLGWLKSYENGIVKAKVNQPVLMDLWNNSVGRTLAKDLTLSDMSDEKLMNHALYHNMLITDATKAFEFYGINDYINTDDWTVDIEWDTSKNTIIVKKEGLKDIELLIGRYGD